MSANDHGSASTYSNHNCRCDDCRRAWADAVKRRKDERLSLRTERDGRLIAEHLPNDRHGSPNTYSNWGCRCADCTSAWTDSYRIRRECAA